MSGIGAFIAGLGTGYVQGNKYKDEQERQKKKDDREQETHDLQVGEAKQRQANEKALRDAAAPATVETGANGMTKPPSADNRDVGLPGEPGAEAGGLIPGSLVNGQATTNPSATAAAYDAPGARQARMIGAMEQTGDYKGAAELKASDMKLQASALALGDAYFKHELGAAQMAGHAGLAQFATKSEVGPLAGKKAIAVVSPDGASVTYSVVQPDGTTQAVPGLTFTNDPAGVEKAAAMLDRAITPMQRIEHAMKSQKTAAEIQELTSKSGLHTAMADYYTGAKSDAARAKADGSPGKATKMDEDDKLLFQEANTRVRDAEKNLAHLMASPEGADPAKNPGVAFAQKALQEAKQNQFKVHVKVGQMQPEELAVNILGVANNQADVLKSLGELARTVGTGVADKVANIIQADDAWKALQKPAAVGAPRTPEGKAIATAPAGGVSLVGGKYVQGPAGGLPKGGLPQGAPAAAVAANGIAAPEQPGAQLDAARTVLTAAVAKLNSYGVKQRLADPDGFAQAQAAVQAAKVERDRAEAAYAAAVGTVRPAMAGVR